MLDKSKKVMNNNPELNKVIFSLLSKIIIIIFPFILLFIFYLSVNNLNNNEVLADEEIIIKSTLPVLVEKGVGFNIQPNGDSSISIFGEGFKSGDIVIINNEPQVNTAVGNEHWMTVIVPKKYYIKEGKFSIWIYRPASGDFSNKIWILVN